MGQYWLNVAILRVVIPVVFTACAVWRPVGLSLVYLVLMLISPMIPIPTHETMKKTTGHYLKACMFLSLITGLTQFTFQIVLLAVPAIYDEFTKNCELLEKLFRHIGLVHIDNATVWEIFYWLLPEIISLPITIIIYCLCKKFTWKNPDPESSTSRAPEMTVPSKKLYDDANTKIINFLGSIGTYIVLASLCCVASLDPSVEGAFYFLIFLGASTWWSCYKEFNKAFAIICRIIMAVVIVHIIVLLTYQNQWPQELIPFNSTWSRYFALDPYYMTNCSNPRNVVFPEEDSEWTNYGYALRLFWLYYVLALQSQYLFTKQKASVAPQIQPDERTPLMRFGSGRTGLLQDSTGSVIVQDAQQDDGIQMQSLSDAPPEEEPGPMEHIIMAVYSIFQLVVNSSYLATNIMMMTWSIMYHSWTTFVFLLWALILWMVPNKRASMMKCSPFIVIYGTLLVLGGYIYSMNLTEIELPTVIHGIKMSEIGFSKTDELSSWHLIVKCCFMTMFWITMRQYMNEKIRNQQTNTLRDMVAPLHLSVSAATAAMQHDSTEIKSQFMKDVGRVVKKLLTKFWIVVVAIMLFTSGITGERMTVFRIIYMTLFLIFVISFQISWSGWRRMMYGFWITVIAYSVVMLMLVYTYQFHNFPNYWQYIGIEEDLQKDIGLEKYETKDLFVRLLTPTFFVIITVLQMHYFHEDFLEATNIDRISVDTVSRRGSLGRSSSIAPMVSTLDVLIDDSNEKTRIYTLKQLKEMSKLERIALFRRTFEQLKNFYNYIWLILEIHMQKIIYLSLMLLCINDVCAINLIFVIAVVVVMNFKRSLQIMAINGIAVTIALLMVTKMLYQIKYINHDNWQVNCTSEIPDGDNHTVNHTKTYNIAEWIGMQKAKTGELPYLLRGYIGIVIVTTCRAIIMVRQCFYRHGRGEPLDTPQVMFPTVTRADADKGIIECLKFLFNYGFYKFGLEFCFMGLVALIGTRLDFFSVLYGIWLLILFAQKRRTIAKIWPFFKCFVIIIVPMQYAFVVAPPTWLCINYPQDYMKLRKWMYLPDPDYPPNAEKLICDFFLLLMIVRQSLVFSIEAKSVSSGQEFIAGHNYSVFHDMDKSNFINPVKDYVSHIYCWLDVVKRGATMSFMWITLSIMFLAGTKRTNLFSLGYLIGAFVFLWQGSDFYLRPVKTILKWWNFLIGYNVIVIFSKAILQGVGCVCFEELEGSACWLVQLLGISCLDKFGGSNVVPTNTPICDVSREDIGMVWDGLCFTFLIIQKRLFKSYYFFHIVDETKAMSILSSRGAELLEDLHKKRIEYQENVEKAVLEKLKFKMDKIKADQQRIQGPSYREPATHKVDSLYPSDRPMYRQRQPKTNREAVRSGDYYMFDDFDDEDNDADLLPDPEDQVEEEERRREQKHTGRRMTISELMTTLLKTDIEIATHVAMYGGTQRDALRLRRQSVPLTRKKSSMSYLSARSETETAAATDDGDRTSLVSSEIEEAEKELKADDLTKSPAPSETGERLDDDDDDRPRDEKPGVSLLTYFKFLLQLINSSMVSATRYLNRFSRDYRYIRKVLAKEKKILKATPDFRMGMRLGINQIWQPIPLMKQSSVPTRTHPTAQTDEDLPELSEVDQPPVIQLLASIWFGILAHSTFMCYFLVFLHQIKNASLLSIPLPLMVFLWGSLTIPRPSKTFWVTMIAYTEAIVIVKCIFQLELISWNHEASPNNPLYPPRIVGVEKKSNYALWDLLLLLMVFFHRFMLKSLGQWTTPYVSRKIIPSKLTLATMRNNGETSQTEPATRFHWQNEDQTRQIPLNNSDQDIPTSRNEITLRNDLENSQHPDDNEDEKLVGVIGEETNICNEKFTTAVNATAQKYVEPAKIFFTNILSPDGKEKTNVYAYMFLCDFFNFILIIFGFSSFGTQQGDGGVAAYFQENRVPMPFLLMLLLQFALIVIDRALFLRKSILGKLIFQYFLVLGVHIWMFFILPSITERQFNERLPPQIWYMIKCFYLLLAAYQLRLGYPTRILGNFLCKNYSIINYGLFKVFMFVPFLFELRAVMDWIWTDTSMTVMDWFKMEDIFASIYQIKCMRGVESDFPQPRGIKKPQMSKYMVGGGALLLIIGLIWFPLLLFALGGTVGVSNIPYEVSLRISIGSYEPIYTMSAQDTSIFTYTEKDFKELKNVYGKSRPAVTFLENYGYSDVAVVRLSGSSKKLWSISPPDKERLRDELLSNDTMRVHVEWTVSRKTDVKDSTGVTKTPKNIDLPAWKNGTFNPIRKNLADLLSPDPPPNMTNATIPLLNVFPKFLKVTSRTTAVVPQLMRIPTLVQTWKDDDEDISGDGRNYLYRNITLNLSSINASASIVQQQWWVVHENCDDAIYDELLHSIPLNNCDFISMFLFNDKAFPTSLSFISGFGILGLYTTAVIVVSQIMRRAVSEMAPKIMFDDMPYVDRILRLCLDIYLVRESGELSLEEDLFAKLIFLYRSPETLIRWTRPPEPGSGASRDGNDDDDDDEVDDVDDEGRERLRNT